MLTAAPEAAREGAAAHMAVARDGGEGDMTSGGGFPAIGYVLKEAARAGPRATLSSLRSRNACKTCALGMGGQAGGMTNEAGRFPEFCKKSVQAVVSDLQPAVDPAHLEDLGLEGMRRMSPRALERLGRLAVPLRAGPGERAYRPIGWDEALTRVADRWAATPPDRAFVYASGRSSNEAGFLLQLFARAFGTNNVTNCSYYCHQASAVGLGATLGQGTGTLALEDLDHTDLLVLVGGNPASNHPRFMRVLMDIKRRGGRVVVVNPLVEPGLVRFSVPSDARSLALGTAIADSYLQPHAGGDAHLFAALARILLDLEDSAGAVDREYLQAYTSGWAEVEADLGTMDADELCRAAGVSRHRVERLARDLAASRSPVFAWTMGVTHHLHGSNTVRWIATVALMLGAVGAPGAGLLPLRGHSNVQGMGTMGVAPHLKPAVVAALAERLGITVPDVPGLDTLSSLQRARSGGMDAALCLGGNLYGASPDAAGTRAAFAALGQVTYLSTTLNTGHAHGLGSETLILPVRARDEEEQATTQESMFSFVRLSDGGQCHLSGSVPGGAGAEAVGPRGEVQVLAEVAQRVLNADPDQPDAVDWAALSDHARVRQAIAEVLPGLEAMADLDRTREEFHIPGRRLTRPRFATPDGRARLAPVPLPAQRGLGPQELRLVTLRSEGQFNGVVYEEHDRYRGQRRRDVVLISEPDLARLGLRPGQRVRVASTVGEMVVLAASYQVRPGTCAMYYPEANVLVPPDADPESRTPAFKNVQVTVTAAE